MRIIVSQDGGACKISLDDVVGVTVSAWESSTTPTDLWLSIAMAKKLYKQLGKALEKA